MSNEMKIVTADGLHQPVNLFFNGEYVSNRATAFYGSVEPYKIVKGWAVLLTSNFQSYLVSGDVYWTPLDATATQS